MITNAEIGFTMADVRRQKSIALEFVFARLSHKAVKVVLQILLTLPA